MSLGYICEPLPVEWCAPLLTEITTPKQWKTIPTKVLLREGYTVYGANGKIGCFDQYTHEHPTIMITCRGATCGNLHISEPFSYINGNAMALDGQPTELVCLNFLYFALKARGLEDTISGSAQPQITGKGLSEVRIPLPSVAEQKVIADKLDTLLTQVENTKARLERIPQILKRFRQSVLAAAMSGRLTEKWRNDNLNITHPDLIEIQKYWSEQSRATGKKYSAPAPMARSSGSDLPNSWLMTSIGQVFNVFVGSTPSRTREDYWNGQIPWVSSSEVAFCRITSTKEAISEAGLSNSSTTVHPVGTVLLAMIGQGRTRGQAAVLDIPACHNQNTAALRVPKEFVVSIYLYYYLTQQYEETRRIGGGNNQKALNKRVVQSMDFPLPPLEEQTEIVRQVDQLFAHADRIELQIQMALKRVNNLTQGILAKAFRGELTEHWRKDNPELVSGENSATALLARINTERENSKFKVTAGAPRKAPNRTSSIKQSRGDKTNV